MKKIILAPALLLIFAFQYASNVVEYIPPFRVMYSKPVSGIGANEAQIQFRIIADNKIITDSIRMSYNGHETFLHPDSSGKAMLKLPPGTYEFQFYYNSNHTEIWSDSTIIKAGHLTGIYLTFEQASFEVKPAKPVIYVYPDTTMPISIRLNYKGVLGFTYPQYNNGWNFTADPVGHIHMNDKTYDYLFWDALVPFSNLARTYDSGFVVTRDSLTSFFEQKLNLMGLNPREQQDFITYWCPLMQKNQTNFVRFIFTEEYDSIATLDITPKPDHIFRVFMVWEDAALLDLADMQPQIIPGVKREGFTVIEWGGSEVLSKSERDIDELSIDEPGIH